MSTPELEAALDAAATRVEAELDRLLPVAEAREGRLAEAMRHATMGGGKRLRPFLALATGRLLGAEEAACLRVGVAVELIHGYSLVHDDLPAMDDATTRRGRPACHKAFDEATAILAGDALQALAFEILAKDDWPARPEQRLALLRGLAEAAGPSGMCGGQMLDLMAETASLDLKEVRRLQRRKTGALITFACQAGCILADADPATRSALEAYARAFGQAFQIKDDLLDVVGDAALAGKDLRRDAEAGKATFVSHLGVEGAEAELGRLHDEARTALAAFSERGRLLHDLFDHVIKRSS